MNITFHIPEWFLYFMAGLLPVLVIVTAVRDYYSLKLKWRTYQLEKEKLLHQHVPMEYHDQY